MERALFIICTVLALQSAQIQSSKLPPSQIHSLSRLQKLLEYPQALSDAFNSTQNADLCSTVPSPSFNLSCNYTQSGSQTVVVLQILGKNSNNKQQQLSSNFSMETLGNLLSSLPDLQIVGLVRLGLWGSIPAKLDHLGQLEVLNLSGNSISGPLPDRLRALSRLQILQLSDNKLNGSAPGWLGELQNLRELDLSHNNLTGSLPKSLFTGKKNKLERLSVSHNGLSGSLPEVTSDSRLGYLNAGANHLGPDFPKLGGYGGSPSRLRFLLLGQNDFQAPIPASIASKLRDIQVLDLSYNALFGLPPEDLFGLSAIETLALNGNQLQGVLPVNLSLSPSLQFLDVSSNFFTGRLPDSFKNLSGGNLTVRFGKNCFSTRAQRQYPRSHCQNRRSPASKPSRFADSHDLAIIAGIIGGGIALLGAVIVFLCVLLRCLRQHKQQDKPPPYAASSCADTASLGVPSDLLSNARYLSQSIRLGVHASSHNRVFSVPELEEATANFSPGNLIGEGQHGKVYRGKLQDGCVVAVKCLTLDPRQDMRQLKAHVELLVKIRHRHLVGYIGYSLDQSEGSAQNRRLFLVSEYVDNGTLRNHISKSDGKELLNWPQRLAAVIGAGRGIQYLHTGVVPGIFNNDVNITNILMDQNCVAKFTDFGLGRHARTSSDFDAKVYVQKIAAHIDLDHHRRKLASDKTDVYNFGFILLEIILGRPPTIDDPKALHPKFRELEMLLTENVPRFEVVDSSIVGTCVAESLNTVLEIAAKCLSEEPSNRPSMEDVLWNLQYAAQVQDRVSGEYTEELPYVSPPRSRFSRQAIRASGLAGRRSSGDNKFATPGPEFLR